MSERELAERLGDLDVDDHVRVTTTEGTTFEGGANPIDYVPEESLRVEVRPGNTDDRYEMSAEYEDGWSDVNVRMADMAGEDTTWEDLGTVEHVDARGEDEWNWGTSDSESAE